MAGTRKSRGWGMKLKILLGALALFAAGVLLSACQTLNENQCQVTDWRTLGSTDGAAGRPQSYVSNHQEACSQYGIAVDVSAWTSGWNEGIRSYCSPQNGLDVGSRGGSYANSCPGDLAVQFQAAYNVGRDVYSARLERDRVQRELDQAIKAVADAPDDKRPALQLQVELKRNQLFQAQNRLNDAQRAVDIYRLRQSTTGVY